MKTFLSHKELGMQIVIAEENGTHMPPVITLFRSRAKAEAYVVSEVMGTRLDRRARKISTDEVLSALKEYNAIFVDAHNGSRCTWWIQDAKVH